jgi:hypothetical protein
MFQQLNFLAESDFEEPPKKRKKRAINESTL